MINRMKPFEMPHVKEFEVANGVSIPVEGMALVQVIEDGIMKVKPSEGTGGEKFVGFSIHRAEAITTEPRIEEVVATTSPVQLSSTLPYQTSTGATTYTTEATVLDVTAGATLTQDDYDTTVAPAPAAAHYQIGTDGKLYLNAAELGHTLKVFWRVRLTAEEVNLRYGHSFWGTPASDDFHIVAAGIDHGIIYTSEYDMNIDWTSPTVQTQGVILGADGKVTSAAAGDKIGEIFAVPTVENPYLGIRFFS